MWREWPTYLPGPTLPCLYDVGCWRKQPQSTLVCVTWHAESFDLTDWVTHAIHSQPTLQRVLFCRHVFRYLILDMHHLTCGISSLLHSVNLIVFTVLLVHLILRISPNHSHHLRSHHLSLPRPFTPDLKLISFTNPFLHSHSYSFRTAFTDLNLYCIKGALAFVYFSFFFWLRVLDKAT